MNEKKNTKHRKISSDRQRRWESMENHSAKYLLTDLPVNTLRFFWSQMEYTHLNATQSSQSASYCLYVRRTNEPNELSEWACLNKIYKHFVIGNYRRNRSTDRVTYFCYFVRFRTFYSVSFFFFFCHCCCCCICVLQVVPNFVFVRAVNSKLPRSHVSAYYACASANMHSVFVWSDIICHFIAWSSRSGNYHHRTAAELNLNGSWKRKPLALFT